MNEAYELLILYTRENQEDAKEIKLKLHETQHELDDIDRKIRTQEQVIRKFNGEILQLSGVLGEVRKAYDRVNPYKKQDDENKIDEEINEIKRLIRIKEDKIKESRQDLNNMDKNI